MGKFSLPIPGRKKQAPQLTVCEPMSKAHKILGSTPLSIDDHNGWDEASTSIIADDKSDGFTPAFNDVHWAIPDYNSGSSNSERQGDRLRVIPQHRRSSATGSETDAGMTETWSDLRKSRSTSTIKSWYDRANQPMSVSQQTSASAMAKGLPLKAQKMLDVENAHGHGKSKKKPTKLDLSSLVNGSRASRKHDTEVPPSATSFSLKSPSLLSPFSATSDWHRESRKIQKRRTKESMLSVGQETSRPATTNSARFGSGSPQALYEHYEEMSLRHILRQDSKSDINDDHTEKEHENIHSHELDVQADWQAPSPTPKSPLIAAHAEPEKRTPSPNQYPSSTENDSNRRGRASRASKRSEKVFQDADLQGKSVLLLSSDSEEDESELPAQSKTSLPTRRSANVEDNIAPLENFRPRMSRDTERRSSRASKASKASKGSKGSKRASFAKTNTYITIPHDEIEQRPPHVDSRASTPSGQAISPSVRASLMSTFSTTSDMTWQDKSGFGIQEARAITMLPARRRSQIDLELETEDEDEDTNTMQSTMQPNQINTSADQLTPPLSPSSMDFYIRSGRSSIDGPGSHNRLMAVTKEEEMLLSALRNKSKERSRKNSSLLDADQLADSSQRRSKSRQPQKEPQPTFPSPEGVFDFGFPAPPSHASHRMSSVEVSPKTMRRVSEPQKSRKHYSSNETNRVSNSLHAVSNMSPRKSVPRNLGHQPVAELQEEEENIPLYLDESEPGLDMSDIKDFDAVLSDSLDNMSDDLSLELWPTHQDEIASHGEQGHSVVTELLQTNVPLRQTSYSPSYITGVVREETEDEVAAGVPRPDSPISPDAFPSVPVARTTISSMARLSAVGTGRLGGEPGWWGDDD